jgi:hypothetical protein
VATQKFRRNYISTLQTLDGLSVTYHEHKATLLWNSLKERLGQTECTDMEFDLHHPIHPADLGHLDEPFSTEEVDTIVKGLPTNKALGPDGFNDMFIKKCWHIIKHSFYELVTQFL